MPRPLNIGLIAWFGLFLWGCDGIWPTDSPWDPAQCVSPCAKDTRCFKGQCVPFQSDGRPWDVGIGERKTVDALDLGSIERKDLLSDKDVAKNPCAHPPVAVQCNDTSFTIGSTLSVSIPWCQIPSGCFYMGSPAKELCRDGTDENRHAVTLTHPFEMMKYETTQDDFFKIAGYIWGAISNARAPVINVNWHEAASFCNKLSAAKGYELCYSCSGTEFQVACQVAAPYQVSNQIYRCPGYRLPTDAEWEYAYRAKTVKATYQGDLTNCQIDPTVANPIAWYLPNAQTIVHSVGGKAANAWGLHDMAGNVWEWVHDSYKASLGNAAVMDPVIVPSAQEHVQRGGSYLSIAQDLRAATRDHRPSGPQGGWSGEVGFRCVRSVK